MAEKPYVMLRVRKETHQRLRYIGALCNENLLETVERLASQEIARLEAPKRSEAPKA